MAEPEPDRCLSVTSEESDHIGNQPQNWTPNGQTVPIECEIMAENVTGEGSDLIA